MEKPPAIKICGLSHLEDLVLCQSLGVQYTGFIFVPKSPRFITPEQVRLFPKKHEKRVGVFANSSVREVLEIMEAAQLDFIQLHGGEDAAFCKEIGSKRVIKVLWPENLATEEFQHQVDAYAELCSFYLLDAGRNGGGSGKTLNWDSLKKIHFQKPWFLAGGLGIKTIQTALDTLYPALPDVLDLNSALEDAPGKKNGMLLREAVSSIHAYRYPLSHKKE